MYTVVVKVNPSCDFASFWFSVSGKITKTTPWNHEHTSASRRLCTRPRARGRTGSLCPPALNGQTRAHQTQRQLPVPAIPQCTTQSSPAQPSAAQGSGDGPDRARSLNKPSSKLLTPTPPNQQPHSARLASSSQPVPPSSPQ